MNLMRIPLRFAQRVFAWTVKELRERLPVVIGILIALPILYVLAITTFSTHLSTAPADKLELALAGVTLLLVWFGLAGDTLAGEVMGGGPSLVRRQPHGMLSLFVAKLLVLGLLTVGLALYAQHMFSWAWQALASEPLPTSAAKTFGDRLADGTNAGLMVTWLALPLLSWPLVTGAWIGRSGAASLAALLLVGMLAVPAWLVLKYAPWLLPWTRSEALGPIALALGLGGCAQSLTEVGVAPALSPVGAGIEQPVQSVNHYPNQPAQPVKKFSLWDDRQSQLFTDPRALSVGDILTVLISINDKAKFNNESERNRKSSKSLGLGAAFDWDGAGTSGSAEGNIDSNTVHQGRGATSRSEDIKLQVAAVVTDVMPNGNILISGSQEVRVNAELRVLTIAGIVRPMDIQADNTVSYERIAEARVSYGGRGRLTEVQQPSYGQQILDTVLPF